MNSKDKGDIAELALALALRQKGYIVSIPFGDNASYDLLIDDKKQIYRVQCKNGRLQNGCIMFSTESNTRVKGKRVRTSYKGKIDFFGVYSPDFKKCYLISINKTAKGETTLRLEETKSGRKKDIRWAKDYEI